MARKFHWRYKTTLDIQDAESLAMESLWDACVDWFIPNEQRAHKGGNFIPFWRSVMSRRVRKFRLKSLRLKRGGSIFKTSLEAWHQRDDSICEQSRPVTLKRLKQREYERRHREKYKKLGLCITCGTPSAPRLLCEKHSKIQYAAIKRSVSKLLNYENSKTQNYATAQRSNDRPDENTFAELEG